MKSQPVSIDLTELNRQESIKQNRICVSIYSWLHYYCCYAPCAYICND